MHINPLRLFHTDVLTTRTIHIHAISDRVIRRDPGLPAMQQPAFANLLIPEEFLITGGAVNGDHFFWLLDLLWHYQKIQ